MTVRDAAVPMMIAVALLMGACASTNAPASPEPAAAATKAAECSPCTVEVENRYDYEVFVLDGRDAATQVGEVKPLGRLGATRTTTVQTRSYPAMGISVIKDEGQTPTGKGALKCRRESPRAEARVDYRYVCGQ